MLGQPRAVKAEAIGGHDLVGHALVQSRRNGIRYALHLAAAYGPRALPPPQRRVNPTSPSAYGRIGRGLAKGGGAPCISRKRVQDLGRSSKGSRETPDLFRKRQGAAQGESDCEQLQIQVVA